MTNRIVFVGNCDAQARTRPTGAYAEKVKFRSYRWLNYADFQEDIILTHLPLPKDYVSFRKKLLGFCPIVLSPSKDDAPLDLANAINNDQGLLEKIKKLIAFYGKYRYTLVASVSTVDVFSIGKKLGIPIAEPGLKQIESGLFDQLNNKVNFVKQFSDYGYKTPNGKVAKNKKEALEMAKIIYQKYGKVMIRKPSEASEQGNLPLVNLSESQMLKKINNLEDDWFSNPLLIEPFLDLSDSPCTTGKINPNGSVELLHTGTQIFSKSAYCWMSPPNYPKKIIKEIETKFLHYMKGIVKKGALGWVDIDWGKTKNNKLIAIESNYRMTGWTPGATLMKRMFPEGKSVYPILFCCDALPIKKRFNLNDLQKKLEDLKINYDQKKKTGVLLHCPTAGNWCGILVLAFSYKEVKKNLDKLNWLTDEFKEIKEL